MLPYIAYMDPMGLPGALELQRYSSSVFLIRSRCPAWCTPLVDPPILRSQYRILPTVSDPHTVEGLRNRLGFY